MAVLTAQGISSVLIELLVRRLSLPRTVTMVPGSEFRGSNGDTITIRVPQPRAARKQVTPGATLTADAADEVAVEVTVEHLYNLHDLTDEEGNLDLENFARQVSHPQVQSIAVGAEDELASAMNDLTADPSIEFALTADPDDTYDVVLDAMTFLDQNDIPPEDRFMAVSSDIKARVLRVPTFVEADKSGSTTALRRAVIGELLGFTFVHCNGLDLGTAVAYHRSGFGFTTVQPRNPRGATDSAGITEQNISLRQVFQYDASRATDQSLVSTFAGASPVWDDEAGTENKRFVKIGTAAT